MPSKTKHLQLIADSGSSKTDWAFLSDGQFEIAQTPGINPMTMDKESIFRVLSQLKFPREIESYNVCFYGAGCKSERGNRLMSDYLSEYFEKAIDVAVYSDMTGAARASCNGKPGICIIQGTGSHAALCDGHNIVHDKASLGYLMGDESSGCHYGKIVLSLLISDKVSKTLKDEFYTYYAKDLNQIIAEIYASKTVSKDLAAYGYFLLERKSNPVFATQIEIALQSFIDLRLSGYDRNIPVYACGSVAWVLKEELKQVLSKNKFNLQNVIQSPIQGLISYHNQ